MDVSFSAWRHSREESLQLKGDSFSFLFDRRYTNRLNRMSRVFFEAYVAATKELAAQEDRFPSLSEIDAKMESGAVYAFKDRLMKNTEFFEEVKISGVSYLVPRALKFVDSTGIYTDLILNFQEGTVVLPTRRKTPSIAEPAMPSTEDDLESPPDLQAYVSEPATEAVPRLPLQTKQEPETYPVHSREEAVAMESEEEQPPAKTPLANEDEPPAPEVTTPTPTPPFAHTSTSTPTSHAYPDSRKVQPVATKRGKMNREMQLAALIGAIILLAAGAAYLLFNDDLTNGSSTNGAAPATPAVFVDYSAYLFNSTNESYLAFDIRNPQGMPNEIEMKLPPNIDESISARGGTVTIAHGDNTTVRMNTSTDASVKIYLLEDWTEIPITLSFASPAGYDNSLQLHNQDYYVTRRNNTLILNLNLTGDGVNFEQSYIKKAT